MCISTWPAKSYEARHRESAVAILVLRATKVISISRGDSQDSLVNDDWDLIVIGDRGIANQTCEISYTRRQCAVEGCLFQGGETD